jgi:hypothetical protein
LPWTLFTQASEGIRFHDVAVPPGIPPAGGRGVLDLLLRPAEREPGHRKDTRAWAHERAKVLRPWPKLS